jgi:hypothetical protein
MPNGREFKLRDSKDFFPRRKLLSASQQQFFRLPAGDAAEFAGHCSHANDDVVVPVQKAPITNGNDGAIWRRAATCRRWVANKRSPVYRGRRLS